jgi:hypothetical protein
MAGVKTIKKRVSVVEHGFKKIRGEALGTEAKSSVSESLRIAKKLRVGEASGPHGRRIRARIFHSEVFGGELV